MELLAFQVERLNEIPSILLADTEVSHAEWVRHVRGSLSNMHGSADEAAPAGIELMSAAHASAVPDSPARVVRHGQRGAAVPASPASSSKKGRRPMGSAFTASTLWNRLGYGATSMLARAVVQTDAQREPFSSVDLSAAEADLSLLTLDVGDKYAATHPVSMDEHREVLLLLQVRGMTAETWVLLHDVASRTHPCSKPCVASPNCPLPIVCARCRKLHMQVPDQLAGLHRTSALSRKVLMVGTPHSRKQPARFRPLRWRCCAKFKSTGDCGCSRFAPVWSCGMRRTWKSSSRMARMVASSCCGLGCQSHYLWSRRCLGARAPLGNSGCALRINTCPEFIMNPRLIATPPFGPKAWS